jgi:hypothetical protein
LEKSYPASKVTTENVKSVTYKKAEEGQEKDEEGFLLVDGERVVESTETYTAQELLTKLNDSLKELTGEGGSGSIDSRIQDAVQTITDREIFDYIRLFIGDYDASQPLTLFQLKNDVAAEVVKGKFDNVPTDKSKITVSQETLKKLSQDVPFVVYTKEGEPVLDGEKKNVTVTFTTEGEGESATVVARFSATPCEYHSVGTEKTVSGEEVTVSTDKKTLALANKQIDTDTVVVKNSEGGVVASDEYFTNSLEGTVEFRKEQAEGAKFSVDYTYHEYVETKTELNSSPNGGAWFKFYPIEKTTFGSLEADYMVDNVELNNINVSNAVTALEQKLAKETDLVEQIIAAVADISIQNALKTITASLEERLTAVEAAIEGLGNYVTDVFATPNEGQVEFALTAVPTARPVQLFINGVRYRENDSFTVDRTAVGEDGNKGYKPVATWLFTAENNGFDLGADFEVVFEYVGDTKKEMYKAE